ncbi:hypothetical protein ACFDR8_003175, partial [Arthrobacter sp. MP_2.3]
MTTRKVIKGLRMPWALTKKSRRTLRSSARSKTLATENTAAVGGGGGGGGKKRPAPAGAGEEVRGGGKTHVL